MSYLLLVILGIASWLAVRMRLVLGMTAAAAANVNTALIAANATFGWGTGNYTVRLGTNTVQPGSIAGWTDATFGGGGPITLSPGWANGFDNLLRSPTLTLLPPSGGFRWVANGGAPLPQTVQAIRVDYNGTAGNFTLGTANLDAPQTVVNSGDQINIGPIQELVTLPAPV